MNEKYIELRKTKTGESYEVNGVSVAGNLTKDVPQAIEVDVNGEKKLVINSLNSAIAVNYVQRIEGGGYEEKVKFYEYRIWGPRCKFFQTIKKGDGVVVKGYLKVEDDSYEKEGKIFSREREVIIIENFDVTRRSSATKKTGEETPVEGMEVDDVDVPF